VKGSDLKKIKTKILKHYDIDEETLDEMLPPKIGKLQLDNKCFLYTEPDSKPVFIETDRGDIFPTLWTMWKFPSMAATISIHAPVSPFVCSKGADVMLPGCAEENLGTFRAGDHRFLLVHHAYVGEGGETVTEPERVNPMPIAVGVMDVGRDDIEDVKKGKAMRVAHYYGDQVWEFAGGGKPNAGFKDGSVEPWEACTGDGEEPEPEPAEQAVAAGGGRVERLDGDNGGGGAEFGGKKKKKDKSKKHADETEEERRERKEKKREKKAQKEAAAAAAAAAASGDPGEDGSDAASASAAANPLDGMSMDELIM
jgi:predicted RNA-binding protein (TIGR00451 family)